MRKQSLLLLAGMLALPSLLLPQPPTLENQLENWFQRAELEAEVPFSEPFETPQLLPKLDLNSATREELAGLFLLSDLQIEELLRHRQLCGSFSSLYELQCIPSLDLPTIQNLLPYVSIGTPQRDNSLKKVFSEAHTEWLLRWSRTLETAQGFNGSGAFEGDPNRLLLRIRRRLENRLSLGLTAEKDPGEALFHGSNPQGFDFYSAHFFRHSPEKRLRTLALGDYTLNIGQGLTLFTGFGLGKGGEVLGVQRLRPTLRPYTGTGEALFLRGAAVEIRLKPGWNLLAFLSRKGWDGNLLDASADSLSSPTLSALLFSGLHRTPAEIEDENTLRILTMGGRLQREGSWGKVSLNAVSHRLSHPLQRSDSPPNRFAFRGHSLLNLSADYHLRLFGGFLFGESAFSHNGASAHLGGYLKHLAPKIQFALLWRRYGKDYQSLFASAFGESSSPVNEVGLYFGLRLLPARGWTLEAYRDGWRFPWLRFGADGPSRGSEWMLRLQYEKRRRWTLQLQARGERKERNLPAALRDVLEPPPRGNLLVERNRRQLTARLRWQLSPTLEWRLRLDFGHTRYPGFASLRGFAFAQDLLFRTPSRKWSWALRHALFDTDGSQVAFYYYEQDVAYAFSIPAYYDHGNRLTLRTRLHLSPQWTLEARLGRFLRTSGRPYGSGNDRIDAPTKTEVKIQLRGTFGVQPSG